MNTNSAWYSYSILTDCAVVQKKKYRVLFFSYHTFFYKRILLYSNPFPPSCIINDKLVISIQSLLKVWLIYYKLIRYTHIIRDTNEKN